ncbi:hypothetical protein GF343_03275 [Candidatus Woesearchaeota archaeon]|nr:hypothetical protein [Candidatus Woesearchaeota archaeon]
MAKRKLIKFGKASYMTILPKKWIDSQQLKEGQMLNIEFKDNILTISPAEIKIPEKIKRIEFSKDEYLKLLRDKIITAYLNGFTTIKISFEEVLTKKQLGMINEALRRCTGLSISSQTEKSVTIKDLLDETKISDINQQLTTAKMSLRNCFFSLEEHLQKKANFESAQPVELATNSLYLAIRSSAITREEKYSYFLIFNNMLTILQTMYNIADLKPDKVVINKMNEIKEVYDKTFFVLLNKDTKKLKELNRIRKNIKTEYKKLIGSKNSNTALVGAYCRRILYLLGIISELSLD